MKCVRIMRRSLTSNGSEKVFVDWFFPCLSYVLYWFQMNVKFNEIKGLQTRWGAYDARLACRERQEKVIVELLVLMRIAPKTNWK